MKISTEVSEVASTAAIVRNVEQATVEAYGAGTFEEALHVLAFQARTMVGAHQCAISYIPNGNFRGATHTHSFSKKFEPYNSYDVMPTGAGIWGVIVENNISVRMTQEELVSHPQWKNFSDLKDNLSLEHPPMRGWLAVPIVRSDEHLLGVLQVSDKYDGDFTQDDQNVLTRLAHMIRPTFELQKRWIRSVSIDPRQDGMTKLQLESKWRDMRLIRFRIEGAIYDFGVLLTFALIFPIAFFFHDEAWGWPQNLVWSAIVLLILSWFIANRKGYIFVSGIGLSLILISLALFLYEVDWWRSFESFIFVFLIFGSSIPFVIVFYWRIRLYFILPRFEPSAIIKLGECQQCSYDLTGNKTGRCPECGQVITKAQRMKNNTDYTITVRHTPWRP